MKTMLACVAAAFSLMCCSPALEQPTSYPNYSVDQFFNERDSTVVLLDPDLLQPNCSAVAVYDHDDTAVLATAAHCLYSKVDKFDPSPSAIKEVHVGDKLLYVTRNDWYYTGSDAYRAEVKLLDLPRDRAILSVNQFEVPEPLPRAKDCYQCAGDRKVHAVSAVYEWTRHDGVMIREMFSGIGSSFWESTISINFGWSGSPVFNSNGEVMGVITRCAPVESGEYYPRRSCRPGWSLFTSLP